MKKHKAVAETINRDQIARKAKHFPLLVSVYDDDGEYFSQEQNIAVQSLIGGKARLTSWRRIETLCDFVLTEVEDNKVLF